jgi:hypothetical protein
VWWPHDTEWQQDNKLDLLPVWNPGQQTKLEPMEGLMVNMNEFVRLLNQLIGRLPSVDGSIWRRWFPIVTERSRVDRGGRVEHRPKISKVSSVHRMW